MDRLVKQREVKTIQIEIMMNGVGFRVHCSQECKQMLKTKMLTMCFLKLMISWNKGEKEREKKNSKKKKKLLKIVTKTTKPNLLM